MTKKTKNVAPEKGRSRALARDPYRHAVSLMEKSEQRQAMAPRLLTTNTILGAALLVTVVINAVLFWKIQNQPRDYFATNKGSLVRLAPTSEPSWSQEDVIAFSSQTLTKAFNLDFVHYQAQITELSDRFSDDGYSSYIEALKGSNILNALKVDRMNLTGTVGAGSVIRRGRLTNGTWFWTIQSPLRLRLVGQKTSNPELTLTLETTIQRVDPNIKPGGMEIRQIITRTAPRNN